MLPNFFLPYKTGLVTNTQIAFFCYGAKSDFYNAKYEIEVLITNPIRHCWEKSTKYDKITCLNKTLLFGWGAKLGACAPLTIDPQSVGSDVQYPQLC